MPRRWFIRSGVRVFSVACCWRSGWPALFRRCCGGTPRGQLTGACCWFFFRRRWLAWRLEPPGTTFPVASWRGMAMLGTGKVLATRQAGASMHCQWLPIFSSAFCSGLKTRPAPVCGCGWRKRPCPSAGWIYDAPCIRRTSRGFRCPCMTLSLLSRLTCCCRLWQHQSLCNPNMFRKPCHER